MLPLIAAISVSVSPFLYLLAQVKVMGSPSAVFANVAGLVGATLLIWQYLLGIRPIADRLLGRNPARLKLHIFLGTYGTVLVMVHPLLEAVSYGESLAFVLVPSLANEGGLYITYGRVALVLFLFVWVTSALFRNRPSYSVWHIFHHATYFIMFFVFLHATAIGTFLNTYPLLRAYWYLLGAVYAGVVLFKAGTLLRKKLQPFIR